MDPHHVLLYVSTLSADAPVTEVAAITRQARAHNAQHRITGMLAFDGMTFVQLLEGGEAELTALLDRLRADPRHVDFELLCFEPATQPRRHPGWSLGYHPFDTEDDALERFRGLRGDDALRAFDRIAADLDADVGDAQPV